MVHYFGLHLGDKIRFWIEPSDKKGYLILTFEWESFDAVARDLGHSSYASIVGDTLSYLAVLGAIEAEIQKEIPFYKTSLFIASNVDEAGEQWMIKAPSYKRITEHFMEV